MLLCAAVAPECTVKPRIGGRMKWFTALQLRLKLGASCNREPMLSTNFGGSIVTGILCKVDFFFQPSFKPAGMIV